MTYAEQLERDTEQTRAQLANTLDELRASMTPGHVLDQLADRVSDGAGAALARNLRDQAVSNPLPLALMGASFAWLMLGPRPGASGSAMRRTADRLRDGADRVADNVRDTAERVGGTAAEWGDNTSRLRSEVTENVNSGASRAKQAMDETGRGLRDTADSIAQSARQTVSEGAHTMRETAGSMADSMQRTASAGYDTMADSAQRTASSISESTKAVREQTLRTGSMLLDFCREQPLLLAGLGVAIGALVGALLPATEAEDQLMGETSDRLKQSAKDLASEQYESAKKVGERAVDAAARDDADASPKAGSAAKSEEPTLVPPEPGSPDESRGQPWTAENAPV